MIHNIGVFVPLKVPEKNIIHTFLQSGVNLYLPTLLRVSDNKEWEQSTNGAD